MAKLDRQIDDAGFYYIAKNPTFPKDQVKEIHFYKQIIQYLNTERNLSGSARFLNKAKYKQSQEETNLAFRRFLFLMGRPATTNNGRGEQFNKREELFKTIAEAMTIIRPEGDDFLRWARTLSQMSNDEIMETAGCIIPEKAFFN